MARLIVEEGGKRRAFKVNPGKISIGSGESATLRLSSPDIAELHADLEVSEGIVRLFPRPGVTPPKLNNRPVSQTTVVSNGATITIGAARITVEFDSGSPLQETAAPSAVARGASRPAHKRVRSSRPLHQIKRGAPPWVYIVGIVAVVAIGFAVASKYWEKGAVVTDPTLYFQQAEQYLKTSQHVRAGKELAKIDLELLSPELERRYENLKQEIQKSIAAQELRFEHEAASEWMDTQLKRFERERLQGEPPREVVRVFLKRCREFRERWPQHPDLSWVDRHESRFRGFVNLSEPPSYKDIEYEIKTMTWSMPRDYKSAFGVLDKYLNAATSTETGRAEELRTKMVAEREAYFLDRMQQAAWHWRRDEKGEAVEWLAQLVMKVGDEKMASEAGVEMTKLPGIEEWLRGYKNNRPEKWRILIAQPELAAFAREKELL